MNDVYVKQCEALIWRLSALDEKTRFLDDRVFHMTLCAFNRYCRALHRRKLYVRPFYHFYAGPRRCYELVDRSVSY